MARGSRLGAVLVQQEILSPRALRVAEDEQGRTGAALVDVLRGAGLFREEQLVNPHMLREYRVPSADLEVVPFDPALQVIPSALCVVNRVRPVARVMEQVLVVAMREEAIVAGTAARVLGAFLVFEAVDAVLSRTTAYDAAWDAYWSTWWPRSGAARAGTPDPFAPLLERWRAGYALEGIARGAVVLVAPPCTPRAP